MKIVLSARGSRGDVQPIIDVAKGFRNNGHQVSLCVPATFEPEVGGHGLNPVFYSEDSHQMMQGFGRGWTGLKKTLEWFSRTIDEQFQILIKQCEGADLLVTGTNEIATPSVAEYHDIPFYRVTFAPMMVGYQSNPLLPWQHLPDLANRVAWKGINAGVDLMARRPINRNRKTLGMAPAKDVGEHVARFGHTLFSMNTTLAPPCPSWGQRYDFTYTGYCHRLSGKKLPTHLESFINDGPPPLYIGFGSVTVEDPKKFTRRVLDASVISGNRVVLGAGWTGLGQGAISKNIFVVGETPHDALFPRMAAVLHHGGAGTTHTTARAGVPQMILPQFADQFFWGHRVAALGLGPEPILPGRLTRRRLAKVMKEIAEEIRYKRNAAALGHIMSDEDGVASIIAAVEKRENKGTSTDTTSWPIASVANI